MGTGDWGGVSRMCLRISDELAIWSDRWLAGAAGAGEWAGGGLAYLGSPFGADEAAGFYYS